jgi:phospholipid/cholesterol/gamma-HCH transport system ATP-binding protein
MVDPLMARVLSNLIQRLKLQMNLTSVVVTHDTRLAQKLADHVIFLDEAKVVFSGTAVEMERAQVPIVQQFLALDRLDLRAMLAILQPSQSAHKTA